MKIIIAGGGIAGLSTYLHFRKHLPNPSSHTITIYESHKPQSQDSLAEEDQPTLNLETLSESTAIVGGGLGISPNGIRVLRDLDQELYAKVVAQGFPAKNFIFKGANGWTLGVQSSSDKAVRANAEQEEVCISSSRHGLWQTVMEHVRNKYGDDVIKYRKVLGVETLDDGKVRVRCIDDEGREEVEEADLVVGADGVKSAVRKAFFGTDDRYQPTYTGQSGVGGFLDAPIPAFITNNQAMVFSFGGNGFFGYSSGGPPSSQQLMWWSTFETSSLPDTKNIDPQIIKSALLERHKHWKDDIIQDVVQKAEVKSIYPTWALPELPHWGERGVVLVGDAAHAMNPTTGQGASQALEDSQTFALLLAELTKEGHEESSDQATVDTAIKLFYQIRSPRVHAIVERGKKLAGRKGNAGIVAEYFMYCFLWLLNKFPAIGKSVLGDVNRELYAWSALGEVDKALKKHREGSGSAYGTA